MNDLAERGPEIAPTKKQKYYPSFIVPVDVLPGLEDEKVGSKIMLKVEAEISSISKYGNGETEVRIELKKAEIISEKE